MTQKNYLLKFDGTNRPPRKIQVEFLKWLPLQRPRIKVGRLDVGSGKSAIAEAIQIESGADYLIPNNALISQVNETYPDINFLKGFKNYQCKGLNGGGSCHEWTEVFEQKKCPDCPHSVAQSRSFTEPTIFNPMSFLFHKWRKGYEGKDTIVVDEAHQLADMLLLLAGHRFPKSIYQFPDNVANELYTLQWLKDQVAKLAKLLATLKLSLAEAFQRGEQDKELAKRIDKLEDEIQSVKYVIRGLEENPNNYAVWIEKDQKDSWLNVKPIIPPKFLVESVFGAADDIVLLSGTVFPSDIKDLFGTTQFSYFDGENPIPKERRMLYYRPVKFKVNKDVDFPKMAAAIEKVIVDQGTPNTVVHIPYSWGPKLTPHFTIPFITNNKYDKEQRIEEFKKKGGVFIAAGCSEGLDLHGDMCRLNILPKLNFPNLGDPLVIKRKALQDGEAWYLLRVVKHLIQAGGRSTRGPDDFSKFVVMDPNFPMVVRRCTDEIKRSYGRHLSLPKSFLEAIDWRANEKI